MINYKNTLVLLLASFAALAFNAQASEKEKNPDKSQVQEENHEHEELNVQKMMTLTEIQKAVRKDVKNRHLLKVFETLHTLIPQNDCIGIILHYGALDEQLKSGPAAVDRWAVTSKSKHKTQDLTHIDTVPFKKESDKFYGTLSNGDVVLSTHNMKYLRIWNPKNKTIVKTVDLPNECCPCDIIVLKDDSIVIQHNGIANIYTSHDMKNPQQKLKFYDRDCQIRCITQLSNGNITIGFAWGGIKIFNRADNVIHDFEHDGGYVQKIVELPKGLLATGTERNDDAEADHAVYIWDLNNEAKQIAKYDLYITDMALLSDARLIVTAADKIYIFNLSHLPQLVPETIIEYTAAYIQSLTCSKDSFSTTDSGGFVSIWQRVPSHIIMAWQAYRKQKSKTQSCCSIM